MTKLLESLTNITYPLADSILFVLMLVIIFVLEKGKFALTWQLIGAGLLVSTVADLMFSYASWNGLYSENST